MARTDPELDEEQTEIARKALLDVRDRLTIGSKPASARAVAEHLSGFGTEVSPVSVSRWLRTGRPSAEAWGALVRAHAIEADAAVPVRRYRRGELRPDDVADLRQAMRLLQRVTARLG